MKVFKTPNYNTIISVVAILLTLFAILLSPKKYIYDESILVNNIHLLHKLGFSNAFLCNLEVQSPGPLYQFLHVFFEPITHLEPVRMRLVNFILFLLILFFTYRYFKINQSEDYLNKSLLYIYVPMLWVIVGLALTEIPAMMFLILSLLLLKISLQENDKNWKNYFISIIAGLCLGLSVLGRTQFLMVLIFSPFLFFLKGKHLTILAYIISSSILPIWIFYVWHGILPPNEQGNHQGLNFIYGFMAVGYLSLMTLFICYKWFFLPHRFYIISLILTLLFLVLNCHFHLIEFEPLKTATHKIPFLFIKNNYKYFMPSVIFGAGSLYIISSIYHILENKSNYWFIFIIVSGLLIIGTTARSSAQFSSRYVVQSLPLFLIAYSEKICINRWSVVIGISGLLLGIVSLLSYYF